MLMDGDSLEWCLSMVIPWSNTYGWWFSGAMLTHSDLQTRLKWGLLTDCKLWGQACWHTRPEGQQLSWSSHVHPSAGMQPQHIPSSRIQQLEESWATWEEGQLTRWSAPHLKTSVSSRFITFPIWWLLWIFMKGSNQGQYQMSMNVQSLVHVFMNIYSL